MFICIFLYVKLAINQAKRISINMAHETEVKDQNTQRDHIGDDEVSELQRPPSFYQKVREQAERFACTRFGQFAIERADRGLKLIEDTTKWSLPQGKLPLLIFYTDFSYKL